MAFGSNHAVGVDSAGDGAYCVREGSHVDWH
jgi:hypothetical protein